MNFLKRPRAASLLVLIVLFEFSAFALLAFRDETFDVRALIYGGVVVGIFITQYALLTRFFKHLDRFLLIIVDVLAAVGTIVQYRLNPDIAIRQIEMMALGMVLMVVVLVFVSKFTKWEKLKWPFIILSILMLGVTLVLGRSSGGARNWFSIAGFSFQPSEFVKLMLVMVLACYFSKTQPTVKLLPVILYGIALVGLLVLAKDLGAAILYAITFLAMLYVGTSKLWLTLFGLGACAGGAVASYYLFDHVRVRVAVWQNPWASYQTQGFQVAQALMAIGSGGFFGMGVGLGSPQVIPAYYTDFVFAVICEEFGIIFGIALVAFYLIFIVRGALIAMGAKNRFDMLVAFGCTTMISMQCFIIIGGVIKMIPLTGITLPFISYGGSSMIVSMMLVGILQGIAQKTGLAEDALMERVVA